MRAEEEGHVAEGEEEGRDCGGARALRQGAVQGVLASWPVAAGRVEVDV